jgi:hypothetical protein
MSVAHVPPRARALARDRSLEPAPQLLAAPLSSGGPLMRTHDPELEELKRTIDLVEYAKKTGYEPRPNDGALGLTVLDHPNGDRIVVARSSSGAWMYASVTDYAPRGPGEPAEQALSRLRHSIDRAKDRGSLVEFVEQRDFTARRGEVPLDRVRSCLREFRATGLPLDFEGALRPPPYGPPAEPSLAPPRDARAADDRIPSGDAGAPRSRPDLYRRRYDWTPPDDAPRDPEVERRLRQWRDAQAAIDRRQVPPRSATRPERRPETRPNPGAAIDRAADASVAPSQPPPTDRSTSIGRSEKPELGRRRYDWSPAPGEVDAAPPKPRNRSPDRDR